MMKAEFEKLAGQEVSTKQYEVIEIVYMYHPAINDKKDIADLFLKFGYTTIEDMLGRSLEIRRVEDNIFKLNSELNKLHEELKGLGKEVIK